MGETVLVLIIGMILLVLMIASTVLFVKHLNYMYTCVNRLAKNQMLMLQEISDVKLHMVEIDDSKE